MRRVVIDIALLALVIYVPYWIYIPAVLIALVLIPLYWESIILGLFVDFYYGPHASPGTIFAYPFALTAALLTLAFIPLRERLRLHV